MKQAFNPILFLMANTPAADQNLEALTAILQLTNQAVINIKNSLDNFHETILKLQDQSSSH
jgi:hypothetical protein